MFTKEITQIGNALGLEGEFCKEFGFTQIMEAIEGPPTEMEEVGLEQWAVVAPSGFTEATFASEEGASEAVTCGIWQGYQVAKLTGAYQRVKPQPVEWSVSVEARIGNLGCPVNASGYVTLPFKGTAACNRAVTLTAAWTE